MNSEERILQALRALAAEDGEIEAPAGVELNLRRAFRGKRARRRAAIWSVAAAALLVAVVTVERSRPQPQPPQQAVAPAPEPIPAVAASGPLPKAPPRRRPAATPREIVTDFFPLMDVPLPFGRGEILRVNLPADAMRTVGLPVHEDRLMDRVQADVLVGEEGMARAIRFVRVEQ